ncbi:MAG: protein translocase subunit SecF [Candidatus Omnitrophota bacterium]|nr:protein translocase subunit SecF [Candidatus Omnitrophota bacterium]MBU2528267.1 protein translocase subunit SecF [bacterium]MBU3929644.1 protein translocase subunit SecF [bacterium]MBU4122128.1 protein translocase subunit SecF [bacterium]
MRKEINFIGMSKGAFALSALLVLFAAASLIRGVNWGIDFTGGTVAQIKFEQLSDIASLRQAFSAHSPVIQEFPGAKTFILKFSQSEEITNASIAEKLKAEYPDNPSEIERFEMVGPVVGEFLKQAAIYAFGGALLGIILYVALRFRGSIWGLAAVIAIIHDVIITFGILAALGISVDLIVVTSLLFIAGYSVNDTIVIYDRLRENLRKAQRQKTSSVFNSSITQTLSRTLITSLTTAVVVVALFIFGGEIIHSFSLSLLIGIIVGTYSSIFVASPLVYYKLEK